MCVKGLRKRKAYKFTKSVLRQTHKLEKSKAKKTPSGLYSYQKPEGVFC